MVKCLHGYCREKSLGCEPWTCPQCGNVNCSSVEVCDCGCNPCEEDDE